MAKHKDLAGQVFGRLTALEYKGTDKGRLALWNCLCECGTKKVVKGSLLTRGRTKSCGCLNKELTTAARKTHGMSRTPFYQVWNTMIMRCHNSNVKSFESYGARGIKVCERWRTFENFKTDMWPGYKPGLTLDRLDNNKGYDPGNCEWATPRQQANNTRRNRLITYKGETLTMSEMARKHELKISTLKRRMYLGWGVEKALETK